MLTRVAKRSFSGSAGRIVHSEVNKEHAHLLSPAFLQFLGTLQGDFKWRWRAVLAQRTTWWKEHATASPVLSLRKDTAWIRDDASWKGPSIVPELQRRWVEITGPAGDAKMVINALNSGANCYMSDFEDSQSPTWSGIIQGQQNMYDWARNQLRVEAKGKTYEVKTGGPTPTLLVRARGLHMVEEHVIDGEGHVVPATLFDYAAYLFHNADALSAKGARPLLYQPKLESYEEAVFVHDMVHAMEKALGIPLGTCRITSLIETLPGILQAEEIGFGLGKYWAGLNCGRWDYIFSVLKTQGQNPKMVFPDRSSLTMDKPFLTQYMQRIVQVSHSRGVHAMGGMSAFLPVSTMTADESAKAMAKVMSDKKYELANGCDGAWVAHPAMVKPIQDLFDKALNGADNQIASPVNIDAKLDHAAGFAAAPVGEYTEASLRANLYAGVHYVATWLGGSGAVAIHNLMEDMATAEISRTQIWTWWLHNQKLSSGIGAREAYAKILPEEVAKLAQEIEAAGLPAPEKAARLARLHTARDLFHAMVATQDLTMFVQDSAYPELNTSVAKPKL